MSRDTNPGSGLARPLPDALRLGGAALCVFAFLWTFEPSVHAWTPVLAWLAAIALCGGQARAWLGPAERRDGFDACDRRLLLAFLALFAACWLPFYADWRWAYTGDSLTWYWVAEDSARHGLHRSLLSVVGVDHHFTYLHSLASNVLQFVGEPSLLAHRLGKLAVTCASLAAIYAFFRLVLERSWAATLLFCVACNYVFLWFSYVSYGHIDSFLFYYGVLALAVLGLRDGADWRIWFGAGLVGGFAAYFTQTSWSGVLAGGAALVVAAVRQQRWSRLLVAVATAVLVVLPLLLQWEAFWSDIIGKQARPVLSLEYVGRIAREIVVYPFRSRTVGLGVAGPILQPPLGVSYAIGLMIAVVTVVPAARRRLGVPPAVPWLLGLFVFEVVLLALTNNAYLTASTKRLYSLIPLYVLFAVLPLGLAARLLSAHSPRAPLILAPLVLLYGVGNLAVMADPLPQQYGFNAMDGLVEVAQRFGDDGVTVFTTKRDLEAHRGGLLDRMYGLDGVVRVRADWDEGSLSRACGSSRVVCFDESMERVEPWGSVDEAAARLRELFLLNSYELRCFACPPAGHPGAGSSRQIRPPRVRLTPGGQSLG